MNAREDRKGINQAVRALLLTDEEKLGRAHRHRVQLMLRSYTSIEQHNRSTVAGAVFTYLVSKDMLYFKPNRHHYGSILIAQPFSVHWHFFHIPRQEVLAVATCCCLCGMAP